MSLFELSIILIYVFIEKSKNGYIHQYFGDSFSIYQKLAEMRSISGPIAIPAMLVRINLLFRSPDEMEKTSPRQPPRDTRIPTGPAVPVIPRVDDVVVLVYVALAEVEGTGVIVGVVPAASEA